MQDRAPRPALHELVDSLDVANVKGVVFSEIFMVDSENCVTARLKGVEELFEAAGWQEIRAQTACTRDAVKRFPIASWQALFPKDEAFNVSVGSTLEELLLFVLTALLTIHLTEAVFSEELADLASACAKVEDLWALVPCLFCREDNLKHGLHAHL